MAKIVAVAILLAGCGPDFAGHWAGSSSIALSCSDGTSSTQAGTNTWSIVDHPGGFVITSGGDCDPISADPTGYIAVRACPQAALGGVTFARTLSGVLHHDEPYLSGTMVVEMTSPGLSCSQIFTGQLSRQ